MLDWISSHKDLLSTLIDFGVLLIWLVYAQLLYLEYRRQRRPRLIINRGGHKDINALCIISNMSAESIFLEYIIAELVTSEGKFTMDLTDFEEVHNQNDEEKSADDKAPNTPLPTNVNENTRQGPLASGGFLHIGTFNEIIQRLARREGIEMDGEIPHGDLKFIRLTMRIIAIYGSEDMPVGAERAFDLEQGGLQCALRPTSWNTTRLSSFGDRRRLRKTLEHLNSSNVVSPSS